MHTWGQISHTCGKKPVSVNCSWVNMSLEVTTSTYVFSMSGDVYLSLASYPGFGRGAWFHCLRMRLICQRNRKLRVIRTSVQPWRHNVRLPLRRRIVRTFTEKQARASKYINPLMSVRHTCCCFFRSCAWESWVRTIPRSLNCFQKQGVGIGSGRDLFPETPADTRVGMYRVR